MISINKILESDFINEMYDICRILDQNLDYKYFYLFMQLVILFHELKHIIQTKLVKTVNTNNKVDLFRKIILDCNNYVKISYQDYHNYKSLFPIEKDANVFGYFKSLDIFLNNQHISRKLCIVLGQICCTSLFMGYSDNLQNSDLKRFYISILKNESYCQELLNLGQSLILKEKLCINFPLNKIEICQCNSLINFIYSELNKVSDDKIRDVLKKKLMI